MLQDQPASEEPRRVKAEMAAEAPAAGSAGAPAERRRMEKPSSSSGREAEGGGGGSIWELFPRVIGEKVAE